ncbi:MAG TPA: hypothetical protein DER56_01745 [Thermosipho africanus]|jgi:hypothetical protein|uniref:2'-5' RNA ligase family protein n=1 Tax=Thermosipho africanus (strain TCF52B) TaxID=484019 RepID=B7IEH8_THEAB|nr:hypothetical protein [Thermosipho africanus]ACJ76405.1 hypothetical protein THA_1984 [Thermosipho africanus TCF52B]HCF37793.1 hypothetical protein [Thermosipho africanus]
MKLNFNKYIEKLKELKENSLVNLLKEWNPKNELFLKVDEKGNYKDFKGDTIIFFLEEEEDKKKVLNIQKKLYSKLGNYLAPPLSEKYFHMTLHDLCNYNITKEIENCIMNNKEKARKILEEIKSSKKIKMKSLGLYNGGSAIGIMFSPTNEEELNLLLNTRKKFDTLIKQNDFYIPHVTLGYYLPIDYNDKIRRKIYNTLVQINADLEIAINFKNLEYVIFENMDMYKK